MQIAEYTHRSKIFRVPQSTFCNFINPIHLFTYAPIPPPLPSARPVSREADN